MHRTRSEKTRDFRKRSADGWGKLDRHNPKKFNVDGDFYGHLGCGVCCRSCFPGKDTSKTVRRYEKQMFDDLVAEANQLRLDDVNGMYSDLTKQNEIDVWDDYTDEELIEMVDLNLPPVNCSCCGSPEHPEDVNGIGLCISCATERAW